MFLFCFLFVLIPFSLFLTVCLVHGFWRKSITTNKGIFAGHCVREQIEKNENETEIQDLPANGSILAPLSLNQKNFLILVMLRKAKTIDYIMILRNLKPTA
ncbi:uncharacterized protein LOC108940902 [Arapaima gigas]